jgi:probable phosphoglycerate mutase
MPRDFQRPFTLPEGATEIILIRHGSARRARRDDAVDLIDGSSDPELTDLGRIQAQALVQRLGSQRASAIYVTPLRRTQQTAGPLAERLGIDPVVLADLREVYLGDWEGQLNHRVARDDSLSRRIFEVERWDVIPGAERMEHFSARVSRGLDRLAGEGGPNGVVLAVVHGGVIAEACRQVTGSRAFAFLYAENGSLTRLMRLRSGRWALISFNDTSHLPSADDVREVR